MRIGFDIDGVIADFMGGFLKFYNNKYDSNFKITDFNDYSISKVLNLDDNDEKFLFDEFFNSSFFDRINLIKGARESIFELNKKNDLILITSRPLEYKKKTFKFLEKNFKDLPFEVYFSKEYSLNFFNEKARVCISKDIDLFFDDYHKYVEECSKVGIKGYLFYQPWNSKFKDFFRVNNWKEVIEVVNGN